MRSLGNAVSEEHVAFNAIQLLDPLYKRPHGDNAGHSFQNGFEMSFSGNEVNSSPAPLKAAVHQGLWSYRVCSLEVRAFLPYVRVYRRVIVWRAQEKLWLFFKEWCVIVCATYEQSS